MNSTFVLISGISVGILSFASILILILKKQKPENSTYFKVGTIIKTWWYIVTFLLVSVGTAPWGLIIGFAVLSIFAAKEYFLHTKLKDSRKYLFGLIIIFILLQYFFLALEKFTVFQILPIFLEKHAVLWDTQR